MSERERLAAAGNAAMVTNRRRGLVIKTAAEAGSEGVPIGYKSHYHNRKKPLRGKRKAESCRNENVH